MDLTCYLYDGWRPNIRPASTRREWMDATAESFAYRCLPLAMANGHGWEILSPCGFDAQWTGGADPADVIINVDAGTAPIDAPVALFGQATLTFHVQGLFRTPPGWNLWVGGSPNAAKDGIAPLAGVIETDWSPYSFTMNWRFTRPNHWIRFEAGEPFCHFFPVERRTIEDVTPTFRAIDEDPALKQAYERWSASRDAFQRRMREQPPTRPADKWQKLYYRGVDVAGVKAIADHQSKLAVRGFVQAEEAGAAMEPARCPIAGSGPVSSASAVAQGDWLMATRERLRALSPRASAVAGYDAIDADTFLDRHYAANRPALLRGVAAHWRAVAHWSKEVLREAIGERSVDLPSGGRGADTGLANGEDAHHATLSFANYLDLLDSGQIDAGADVAADGSARNARAFEPLMHDIGSLDTLLDPDRPTAKGILSIGPAGTFTPLDQSLTNSLLIQLLGRKRVTLASPDATPRLRDDRQVFDCVGDATDRGRLAPAPDTAGVATIIVDLDPGDALFLPIGWWHQVCAIEFSASITNTNFRWPNDFYPAQPA